MLTLHLSMTLVGKGREIHKQNHNQTTMHFINIFRNHIIGGAIGGTVTITFGTISVFSRHFRCYLVLIVPSLFSGRGRSLLMTVAVGILLDGL